MISWILLFGVASGLQLKMMSNNFYTGLGVFWVFLLFYVEQSIVSFKTKADLKVVSDKIFL